MRGSEVRILSAAPVFSAYVFVAEHFKDALAALLNTLGTHRGNGDWPYGTSVPGQWPKLNVEPSSVSEASHEHRRQYWRTMPRVHRRTDGSSRRECRGQSRAPRSGRASPCRHQKAPKLHRTRVLRGSGV